MSISLNSHSLSFYHLQKEMTQCFSFKIIDAWKMEQALIFVRTKLEADNLEKYFAQFGEGRPGKNIFLLFKSVFVGVWCLVFGDECWMLNIDVMSFERWSCWGSVFVCGSTRWSKSSWTNSQLRKIQKRRSAISHLYWCGCSRNWYQRTSVCNKCVTEWHTITFTPWMMIEEMTFSNVLNTFFCLFYLICLADYTLPDNPSDYIHRIGRVGRADAMGLAISIVATHPEKVWFHRCPSRGKNCNDTRLVEEGGCGLWWQEMKYLKVLMSSDLFLCLFVCEVFY